MWNEFGLASMPTIGTCIAIGLLTLLFVALTTVLCALFMKAFRWLLFRKQVRRQSTISPVYVGQASVSMQHENGFFAPMMDSFFPQQSFNPPKYSTIMREANNLPTYEEATQSNSHISTTNASGTVFVGNMSKDDGETAGS